MSAVRGEKPTGGKNDSANHMDFLRDKPDVTAILQDGKKLDLVIGGKVVI